MSYNDSYNEKISDYSKSKLKASDEKTSNNSKIKKLTLSDKQAFYNNHEEFVVESLKEMRVKKEGKPIRFKVEADKKKIIIGQLEKLGVNTGKIYVNLDNISNHLRDKYKN